MFVVEVSRGADSVDAPNNYADQPLPQSPALMDTVAADTAADLPIKMVEPVEQKQQQSDDAAAAVAVAVAHSAPLHNGEVQVHQPPADSNITTTTTTTTTDAAVDVGLTGLSLSDLSVDSSGATTRAYTYGQVAIYAVEAPGYEATINNAQAVAVPAESLPQPPPSQVAAASTPSKAPTNGNAFTPIKMMANVAGSPSAKQPPSAPLSNGNGCAAAAASDGCNGIRGTFDSLMNLPDPPSMDEIKLLNEFAMVENNNMDSLPPPPPLELVDGGIAGGI